MILEERLKELIKKEATIFVINKHDKGGEFSFQLKLTRKRNKEEFHIDERGWSYYVDQNGNKIGGMEDYYDSTNGDNLCCCEYGNFRCYPSCMLYETRHDLALGYAYGKFERFMEKYNFNTFGEFENYFVKLLKLEKGKK